MRLFIIIFKEYFNHQKVGNVFVVRTQNYYHISKSLGKASKNHYKRKKEASHAFMRNFFFAFWNHPVLFIY